MSTSRVIRYVAAVITAAYVLVSLFGLDVQPVTAIVSALFLGVSIVFIWSRTSEKLEKIAFFLGIPVVYLAYLAAIRAPETVELQTVGMALFSGIMSVFFFRKAKMVVKFIAMLVFFAILSFSLGVEFSWPEGIAGLLILYMWAACVTVGATAYTEKWLDFSKESGQ